MGNLWVRWLLAREKCLAERWNVTRANGKSSTVHLCCSHHPCSSPTHHWRSAFCSRALQLSVWPAAMSSCAERLSTPRAREQLIYNWFARTNNQQPNGSIYPQGSREQFKYSDICVRSRALIYILSNHWEKGSARYSNGQFWCILSFKTFFSRRAKVINRFSYVYRQQQFQGL